MNSISNQILTSILIATLVVFGSWSFIEIENTSRYETEKLEEDISRAAERLSISLAYPVWNLNLQEVYANISKEAMDKNIQAIEVYDESGQPYAGIVREKNKLVKQVNNQSFKSNPDLKVKKVFYNKKPIAYVVIHSNKEPLHLMIKHLRVNFLIKLSLLLIALASFLFMILRRVVIKPLLQLKDWVSSVSSDKLPPPTNFYTTEIDELARSFSQMTERLISSHNEILEKNRKLEESESHIKSINDNLSSGMIYQLIIKPDGARKFTYVGDNVKQLYGVSAAEAMSDHNLIYDKVFEEDKAALLEAEKKAIETLSTFKKEVRIKNPSGTYRWSYFVSTPTLLPDGSTRWNGIEFDITDRKLVEEELRLSQQKFSIAFNNSPEVILITDLQTGRIIESNEAIMNIYGYTREEVIGKTTLELGLYKNPEDRKLIFEEISKNKSIRNLELTGKHKSGSELTVILSIGLSEINGKQCLISSIHDITERKKMEEELMTSQQKFAIAFNSNPDVIFITEQSTHKIIEVNQAISKVYGYTREEAIGKTPQELNLFKDDNDRQRIIDILNEQGAVHKVEIIGKNKYGADLNLLISIGKSIIDYKPCYIIISHDITQRKQAEEKLRQSEERYKSIISVSNTGAWEYHSDTDYLWCSPEYFSMLGRNYTEYEMTGNKNLNETWLSLIHPDDQAMAANQFSEYLKNGSLGTYENHFRMLHADGSWRWIWSRGQTLRDVNGNVTNLTVGTHIDITERKLAEIELQKLNLDKDRFMSILSHDLRSPFNGIVGILDMLCADMKSFSKPEIENLIQMADKSAHNASELLDDVLMWSMAQAGKMEFAPMEFNFKEDCEHVIKLLQSVANSKNIEIDLNVEEDLMVFADKNMLDTILRNIISNALKFTNEGGNIKISTKKTPQETVISIADNGIGIDPGNAAKIFDKAELYTSEGTNHEKGTGFGLKMSQEFVEKHNGKIWVESQLGKGTTFYFTLPNKEKTA